MRAQSDAGASMQFDRRPLALSYAQKHRLENGWQRLGMPCEHAGRSPALRFARIDFVRWVAPSRRFWTYDKASGLRW
jgi:hypothetical protein